jgi:DNA-binding transcriptional LysR family regulator
VLSNQLFLVKSSKLAMEKNMPLQEMFNKYALIVRENGSGTRQTSERFLSNHIDIEKIKKMELTSNEAVKQAVLAGLGLSIMPLIGLKNELINNEVSIVNAKGLPLNNSWQLVWAKGRDLPPVAVKYIEYLRENLDGLKIRHFDWYRRYKVEI